MCALCNTSVVMFEQPHDQCVVLEVLGHVAFSVCTHKLLTLYCDSKYLINTNFILL